jgi:hypothetical protein
MMTPYFGVIHFGLCSGWYFLCLDDPHPHTMIKVNKSARVIMLSKTEIEWIRHAIYIYCAICQKPVPETILKKLKAIENQNNL